MGKEGPEWPNWGPEQAELAKEEAPNGHRGAPQMGKKVFRTGFHWEGWHKYSVCTPAGALFAHL